MRSLLDENQHAKLIPFLDSLGHDVRFGEKRLPDYEICRVAKREKRLVITYDKEFADIKKFPPKIHCGIILLRINPLFLPLIKEQLVALFTQWPEKKLCGTTVAVFEDRFVDLNEGVTIISFLPFDL